MSDFPVTSQRCEPWLFRESRKGILLCIARILPLEQESPLIWSKKLPTTWGLRAKSIMKWPSLTWIRIIYTALLDRSLLRIEKIYRLFTLKFSLILLQKILYCMLFLIVFLKIQFILPFRKTNLNPDQLLLIFTTNFLKIKNSNG